MSQKSHLTRHFFDRFFDKDSISAGSDPRANVIQAASLFAVPGLMLTFWMHYSPYFFVSYSMIVMGLVMIFKWDSLFLDRRDYLILGSLPIRYRDLFVSKFKALFLFLAIFAVSANLFSTLAISFGAPGSFRVNFVAHTSAVFGGALFMMIGFCALQGLLISILPVSIFRRISPVVQMVSITVLLTIFLIFPLIQASIQPLAEQSSEVMDYFPIFWFLGLYVFLMAGGDPNPIFGALALKAIYGLLFVIIMFVVTYTIAYRRHARSIVDAMDTLPPRDAGWRLRLFRRLDHALFRHQVQHGCYRFIGRILSRSPRHQVFLAIYLAVGFSLGLSSLFTFNPGAAFPFEVSRNGMLELPLILSFFVVSGLRATFNIPHELPANWAFQVTDKLDARHYIAATRKWVATSGLLPLAVCVTVLEFAYWPWRDALLHLAFETIVSLVLVQVLFFSFRKVPFTCSYFPGKKNMAILAAVYLYGFTTYSASMVALENWLLLSRFSIGAFLIVGVASIMALSAVRRRRHALLIYEEQSDAELQSLGLN